jgi:predicted small lipoprotein YifL
MKKLFIAAAVIVMAGSMASCGQKTQKAAQDTAATEPTEQVEAVEIEAVTPESEIPAAAESQKTQPEQANNK